MPLFRRIRPEKTGVRAPLGDLEYAVMRHIWDSGEEGCLAAEVQRSLEQERSIALTTVLTTLDRLHDKSILVRVKEGKAFRYRAALTENELQQRIVEGVLGDLKALFPDAVATYFAQYTPQGPDPTRTAAQTHQTKESLRELARQLEQLPHGPGRETEEEENSDNEGAK